MSENKGGQMAETKEKPSTDEPTKTESESIDEEIAVFEPVAKAVDVKLVHPGTGEEVVFVQHELSFFNKLKFFRLLTKTIREASESEAGGIGEFIAEALDSVSSASTGTNEFLETVTVLVESVPTFAEDAYILALNVRPQDEEWVKEALTQLDDDAGFAILDNFVAQNGKALRDFFAKRLRKVGQRVNQELGDLTTQTEEATA